MIICLNNVNAQEKTFTVKDFDGVIVSPHVEVIFIQAEEESVVIENIDVSMDKLNVEVKGKTLHIYLDDAKMYTKSEKVKYDDYKSRHAIYTMGQWFRQRCTTKTLSSFPCEVKKPIKWKALWNRR